MNGNTLSKILQTAPIRKGIAALQQVPRSLIRLWSKQEDYVGNSPILVNSFPKSGTHMLLQMMRALPGRRYFGSFIASTPSISMRERSDLSYRFAVERLVPAEVVPAHLYYRQHIADRLDDKNTVHYFIYRDLRDVAVSEAMYLTYMTQFHRLHRRFRAMDSDEARISAAILGLRDPPRGVEYPNIAERFSRYAGWLRCASVCSIKFEDLRAHNNEGEVRKLVEHYNSAAGNSLPVPESISAMRSGLDPSQSHTYRKGKVGGWKERFTSLHVQQMKEVAGSLLIELGYERDQAWGLTPQ